MSATTRWKDNSGNNIKDICKILEHSIADDQRAERERGKYWVNIRCNTEQTRIQKIKINNINIKYKTYSYRYDVMTVEDLKIPSDDTPSHKKGLLIVYEDIEGVHYIIDQNSSAQKVIRKFLGYTGKSVINQENQDYKSDFYVWLVYKFYENDGVFDWIVDGKNKELEIKKIQAIKGDTEDYQTNISADGESVMNVISSLSFLLESHLLKMVDLRFKYTNHNCIRVKMNLSITSDKVKQTIELDQPYIGLYDKDSLNNQFTKIYLLLYIEILPLLFAQYTEACKTTWNHSTYINFLKDLENDIKVKIDNKIKSLSARVI